MLDHCLFHQTELDGPLHLTCLIVDCACLGFVQRLLVESGEVADEWS